MLARMGVQVIGEAADGQQAVAETKRLRPDLVFMDIAMPRLNGIEATRQLTREMPGLKIIGLSLSADPAYAMAMLEAGAAGYMTKNAASQGELVTAMNLVTQGGRYLSPAIASRVVAQITRAARAGLGSPDRPVSSKPGPGEAEADSAAKPMK